MNPTPLSRSGARAVLAAVLASAVAAGLGGCASTATPVVYKAGAPAPVAARTEADLQTCRAEAETSVGINSVKATKVSASTAKRGAMEFVDKAVESVVNGSRSAYEKARGAAAGAMAGTVTSVVLNWNEPDAVYREYVDLCMKERGHKVLGWR